MKRRHQRRTILAVLASLSLLGSSLAINATPAAAMPKIAGVGKVTTGGTPLNARSGPSSANAKTGEIRNGTYISIVCQVIGQHVDGNVRATRIWDMLPNYSFVADAYISRRYFKIPVCDPATTGPTAKGAWMLPVTAGLVSGFRTASRPAHDGVDLAAARNTPIHAAAAGTVIRVTCNTPSNNCDVDGGIGVGGCGWYVEVQHPGNIVTRYCHMVRRPSVTVGQVVAKGAVLGYVGMSGNASGPHLHFEVHTYAPPATHANAVNPIYFMRARGLAFGG
jgi:murein DD-endopeptidase MepM/ murein hydrolase activator NlpD